MADLDGSRAPHSLMRNSTPCGAQKMEKLDQLFCKRAIEPGAGEGPEAIRSAAGHAHRVGRLLMREAGEVTQFHYSRRIGVVRFELGEGIVEREQVIRGARRRSEIGRQV